MIKYSLHGVASKLQGNQNNMGILLPFSIVLTVVVSSFDLITEIDYFSMFTNTILFQYIHAGHMTAALIMILLISDIWAVRIGKWLLAYFILNHTAFTLISDHMGVPQLINLVMLIIATYIGLLIIDRRKIAENKYKGLSDKDPLTNLFNRRFFNNSLQNELEKIVSSKNSGTVLFLDLDEFKIINDEFGHLVGDRVLQVLAERLQLQSQKSFIVARLGGDEIGILAPETDIVEAELIAMQCLRLIAEPIYIEKGIKIYLTASIGISVYPDQGDTIDKLLGEADQSMYLSKGMGGNTMFLQQAIPLEFKEAKYPNN